MNSIVHGAMCVIEGRCLSGEQQQRINELEQQRDELLAAAEKAVTALRELAVDAGCNDDDANEIAAAIAKVKP